MRFLSHLGVLLLLTAPVWAKDYKAYAKDSKVGFSISHFADRAEGKFGQFHGTLHFNSQDPASSSVEFQVGTNSIDTRNQERDSHLRGTDYFDSGRFPEMTFQSKSFRKVGSNKYMVTGPLTIKGVSKPVTVPVKLVEDKMLWATGVQALRFESTFEINRLDFGVGGENAFLGNEVRIELRLEFHDEAGH
ncbi:MAG: YceI family protein [Vulcanimicrobiota bacterium]